MIDQIHRPSRRGFMAAGLLAPLFARPAAAGTRPGLADIVQQAMQRHYDRLLHHDLVGIADFAQPSRQPRFWVVDRAAGTATAHLVAHGSGSDPEHSGWLHRFSNAPGSNASSAGAYRTGDPYVGKHGRSQRLAGLDPENNNAEARAIVIHGAWYVSTDMARRHGKIGRSQGCFAFDEASLDSILARLGAGRLIYAGRFGIAA